MIIIDFFVSLFRRRPHWREVKETPAVTICANSFAQFIRTIKDRIFLFLYYSVYQK
jgi:hypothetical protein